MTSTSRCSQMTMQHPTIVIAPFDEKEASDSVRGRLLLHWVNSLPLTKCLLVEELRDLRFGDVLFEVVAWLQHDSDARTVSEEDATEGDEFGKDVVKERLRRVVQFVASECRSRDEDAMYVVNDGECVARVMAGQSDAICAVLTVLKRLSVQRMLETQSSESDKDALRRRHTQEKWIEHSLQRTLLTDEVPHEGVKSKHELKRVQSSSSRSRTRVNTSSTKPPKSVRRAGIPQQKAKLKTTKQDKKKPTAGAKRRLGNAPVSSTSVNTPSSSDKKKISHQASFVHDSNGLRVFGMLDPTAKSQLCSEPSSGKGVDSDDARAARFCNWARLVLRLEMSLEQIFVKQSEDRRLHSPRKIRQVFSSGVLLCRIAAAIIRRHGGHLNKSSLETKDFSFDNFAPASDPNTAAGRRRNFALALAVFKGLGVSPEALSSLEILQHPGKQTSPKTIWYALEEVLDGVERLARDAAASNTQDAEETRPETPPVNGDHEKTNSDERIAVRSNHLQSPRTRKKIAIAMEPTRTGCAPLNRSLPYITSEQMHVVCKWLIGVGFDVKQASGRGVLQDPMRNGVLLSALLIRVLKSTPFSYFKTPRTLTEMRENISKAFERLVALPHGQIPSCYFTSTAEQAVLIGDRQTSYGLLWHLWQASHATLGQVKTNESGEVSPTGRHETRKAEGVELGGKRPAPVQPSPLLLDIPAVVLAGHGKCAIRDDLGRSFQIKLHDDFARRLAWSENDPNDDNDDGDLFPVPKAPFSSPVYSDELDPVSTKTHENEVKHQYEDDILPTHSGRSDSAVRSRRLDQESDTIAPSIVIAELSVVTPTTVSLDPAKPAKQDSVDDAVMPSPFKPPTAEAPHNATSSQEPVGEVLAWLKRLGVQLKNVSAFHDSGATLAEFQSGVLLCCIVEKVELMRSIPGVTRPSGKQPLHKASALHNITKALNILQQKKTMPLHLLRRANSIYAGSRDVILQLLLQIRKAYGHHHQHHTPRRRLKQPSSAA